MSSGVNLRAAVLAARDWLCAQRADLHRQHQAGSPGIQVSTRLTDMLDRAVLDLYRAAINDLISATDAESIQDQIALVALGGQARREVAPFSDADVMVLHLAGAAEQIDGLRRRLQQDLSDVRLSPGQNWWTIEQACKGALKDATVFTSLIESRLLAGSETLFARFQSRFRRTTRRHWRRLVGAIDQSRGEQRAQFGETVYLLEPNVKESPGGLRDMQLLRWVGFVRYGQASPESLQLLAALSKEDQIAMRRATEFFLRVRNELHFHAQHANDVLDRAEQVRLADLFGCRGADGILPVEQFMRDYFRHSRAVQQIVSRFVEGADPWIRWGERLSPIFGHQVEGDFRVGPTRISATKRGLKKLRGDLVEILRLADLANMYNKRIAHSTWEAIHRTAPQLPAVVPREASERFLSLLSQPARLGELLRSLHELGALEKLIPAFTHARGLLQFNEYHKYTVDEHCLRAVEAATSLLDVPRPWAKVYRSIQEKRTLHLALLIHDLGKGYVDDHSDVGLQIAEETARRLRMPPREAETLKFLVHKHLMMSHLAFRRDTSDDQLIVRFAVEVGSAEVLRMLLVLTCADLAAVGPGVFNSWKGEVLIDLYERALRHLSGDTPSLAADERRADARTAIERETDTAWFERQIDLLPSSYLMTTPAPQIADELRRLRNLGTSEARVWHLYSPETKIIEYTIGTYESITPGVFHKLAGALSSQGLQILSANINTLADGLVLDRFRVQDPDFSCAPASQRLEEIDRRLIDSLACGEPPVFRRVWQSSTRRASDVLHIQPTRVRIDNSTSEQFTIIDVFACDRLGLLYTISRTLFDLGLSVSLAKIGTYLDQVVDVFYVTDELGDKIENEDRLDQIRTRLLQAIQVLESGAPANAAQA
ncbi:MAG: [protein-PII] uridylyltransferase [Pirellulales bacterium]|nr:[protein-PII] uridylyltransferase [Pirellulales bacterium]